MKMKMMILLMVTTGALLWIKAEVCAFLCQKSVVGDCRDKREKRERGGKTRQKSQLVSHPGQLS